MTGTIISFFCRQKSCLSCWWLVGRLMGSTWLWLHLNPCLLSVKTCVVNPSVPYNQIQSCAILRQPSFAKWCETIRGDYYFYYWKRLKHKHFETAKTPCQGCSVLPDYSWCMCSGINSVITEHTTRGFSPAESLMWKKIIIFHFKYSNGFVRLHSGKRNHTTMHSLMIWTMMYRFLLKDQEKVMWH